MSFELPTHRVFSVVTALIIILSSSCGVPLVVIGSNRLSLPGLASDTTTPRESSVLAAGRLLREWLPADMGSTNVHLASEATISPFARVMRVVAAPMFHVAAESVLFALGASVCLGAADFAAINGAAWVACPLKMLTGLAIELPCASAVMSVESLRRRARPPAEPPPSPQRGPPGRGSRSLWVSTTLHHDTVQDHVRRHLEAAGDPLREYVDRVGAAGCSNLEDVPESFRGWDASAFDPSLAVERFSTVLLPPVTAQLTRTEPQRATSWRPHSLQEMLTAGAWARLETFLRQNVRDMEDMLTHGLGCQRLNKPRPLVLGQSDLVVEARGIVWDLRQASQGIIKPLDFLAPISSELNINLIEKLLDWCPDRELLDHIRFGVDFKAALPLQTVLLPHMNSLAPSFALVEAELIRLKEKGWHHLVGSLPFLPCRINPNGSVSRKLESARPRRTTNASADGASSAGPLRDCDGVQVISLNAAVGIHEHDPPSEVPDSEGGLTPAFLRNPKWPKESKPTIRDKIHDISVLRFAGKVFKEPIVGFVTDFADYFSQFALHPKVMWANVVHWLKLNDIGDAMAGCFVNETRLGFGVSASSNVCQRFAHAVVEIFRRAFDREEAALFEAETDPDKLAYLSGRRALGVGQCRLFELSCYTDDPMLVCVGIDRLARAMRLWHRITKAIGLVAAIPRKRQCGAQLRWLGLDFMLSVGVLLVPHNKRLRALAELTKIESEADIPFDEYRAAVSFLQYLRPLVEHMDPSYMYGLYEPFKRDTHGMLPSAKSRVVPSRDIRDRAKAWRGIISSVCGASFSSAKQTRAPIPSKMDLFLYSDAALEGAGHPGLGGYCEGLYWTVKLTGRATCLPISVLEFVAVAINMIVFVDYVGAATACFCSDSLNSVQVLNNFSAKSILMQFVHRQILALPAYQALRCSSAVVHVYGPSNPCADAVSRGRVTLFLELCSHLGVVPVLLEVLTEGLGILEEVCDFAESRDLLLTPKTASRRPVLHRESIELAAKSPAADGFGAKGTPKLPPRSSYLFKFGSVSKPSASLRHQSGPSAPKPPPVNTTAHFARPYRRDESLAAASHKRGRSVSEWSEAREQDQPRKKRAPKSECNSTTKAAGRVRMPASFNTAVHERAATLARQLELDSSPEALRPDSGSLLAMCTDYFDAASTVLAAGTGDVDDLGWRRWCTFCKLMGTPPIRPAHVFSQLECRDRETILQRQFVVYCVSIIEPRSKKSPAAKPQSSFNMLLAVKRIHKVRFDIPMSIFPGVATALKAITKAYILEHGAEALLPERKEPLDTTHISRILALPEGTIIGSRRLNWNDSYFISIKALLCTGFAGAFRKAELCLPDIASLDERRLRRSSVSWMIGGVASADPSEERLRSLLPGDFCVIKPPLLKNDPFGLHFGTKPIFLPVHDSPTCAARAIAAMLIAAPCPLAARSTSALFCGNSAMVPLRHGEVDRVLHALLLAVFPGQECSRWSIHSLRIGAACALLASGASTALIQAIGRWRSTKSIDIYARLGAADYGIWLLRASQQAVDAITARNLPRLDYDSIVSILDGPAPSAALLAAGNE